MAEFAQALIIVIGIAVAAYGLTRIIAFAWFCEKCNYHRRLMGEINKGDKVP